MATAVQKFNNSFKDDIISTTCSIPDVLLTRKTHKVRLCRGTPIIRSNNKLSESIRL